MSLKSITHICLTILPLGVVLSGCPSFATVLPEIAPSLVPSVNLTSVNVNTNQISCYPSSTFSSSYCSIPLSKFVGIVSGYADPYNVNLLLAYDVNNKQSFFFDHVNHRQEIESLNQYFIAEYPSANNFALLPLSVQDLYIKIREDYIPHHNYKKLYHSYIYLYTISALHSATNKCKTPAFNNINLYKNTNLSESAVLQRAMLYKAFTIQYSNAVLYHIANKVDSTYDSEIDLYNAIYEQVLKINPNQLQNIAQDIYAKTNMYAPQFESSFFTLSGTNFGDLGNFACTQYGGLWTRYDYEYFGRNLSGIDIRVKFKQHDTIANTNDNETQITDGI